MNYSPADLKRIRKERKLTQAKLGELIGLSKEMINKMEAGTKNITELTAIKLRELEDGVEQSSIKGAPLISFQVAAGFGTPQFVIKEEDVMGRYVVPDFNGIDFMIRVKGSSMYPKYSSGDIVACRIINETTFIQWNKPYVIATKEQGMLCKRLLPSEKEDHLKAISDNKEYPPFDIPKSEITGIALIIGVIRLE